MVCVAAPPDSLDNLTMMVRHHQRPPKSFIDMAIVDSNEVSLHSIQIVVEVLEYSRKRNVQSRPRTILY
jgi:hypothetical protein